MEFAAGVDDAFAEKIKGGTTSEVPWARDG